MLTKRLKNFIIKPLAEKIITIRFFVRRALSKLPFLPVPVKLSISRNEKISFWWSYVFYGFDPEKGIFDYRGDNIGELCFLYKVLRHGMVFIDIGAYHGIYTIVAAKKLGSNGGVVAFEPSPRDRRRLLLHLRLNWLFNVRAEPYAVSSSNGTSKFFVVVSGFTTTNSLRYQATQGSVKEIVVDTITLDKYCNDEAIKNVDILKIDAEGAELGILRSAENILTYYRPLIICEVIDWVTQQWGYSAREIISYLKKCNYTWFEFRQDGTLLPHEGKDEYPDIKNYLAVPKEKFSLVKDIIN